MKYIGAHVSTAGGVENAPLNAAAIGANAFALFTKNQRQWSAPPLSEASIAAFRKNCAKKGFGPEQILPHDSYLINLGNPNAEKRKVSVQSFIGELRRCDALGLTMLNFHPGSHLRLIEMDDCLKHIAAAMNRAAAEVPHVKMVIENTAGQGSNVGFSFAQIGRIIELVEQKTRVGVCFDTCHGYAAGYDIGTDEGFARTFEEFDREIGAEYLCALHLNDAKAGLTSHLDRHESIGKGTLGVACFQRIMQSSRFDNMPLILETIDDTLWAEEIRLLRSLA